MLRRLSPELEEMEKKMKMKRKLLEEEPNGASHR
jgi:hypothetical protein